MDCRVVVKHSSEEEVLSDEHSAYVRALQMLRLRNNFDFLQERLRTSTNIPSETTEQVDLGAAGDASSGGHYTLTMDTNSASSSFEEEDNPIPPEHRPKWCKSKRDLPRRQSPPREVEHVATYPPREVEHVATYPTREVEHVATYPPREVEHVATYPPREVEHVATYPPREVEHVATYPPREVEHVATYPTREVEHVATYPTREVEHVATYPLREVEHVATYPSLLDDPILDTPAIWSSKDRSRLYMYQRNAVQPAMNAEEASNMGETSSQRRQAMGTQQCLQGGGTLAAQSSGAIQTSPSTSRQGCSMFSAEANIAASFQRTPALSMQGNSNFSAKTNVASSFETEPISDAMRAHLTYCSEKKMAAIFKKSFQESLLAESSGADSVFQSIPASSTQRSAMLSDEESLVEALENTIFFPVSTTSATQINSGHSLEASSSSSFQGSLASSLQGSSTASLQANLAATPQGNPMSFNGNSAHYLSNSPFSFYSNILNLSKPGSPPQSSRIYRELPKAPPLGKASSSLSFPQTVTQTYHGQEIIQRNLSQQIQSASEERQSSLKGSISLQEMSTGIGLSSTSAPLFESVRSMQRPTSENRAFAPNTVTELMSVPPRLDRSQSFQNTTSYQETQMEQLKPSTSSYTMSVIETPFNGWQPLNGNLAQPGNGPPKFNCFGKDVGASGEEVVVSPSGEPTKKKRRHEKLSASISTTKLRKELPQVSNSQDNGFLYTPHDFPELPNRSFHGNHGHVDQQEPQCSTAETSIESSMAMSVFQPHPSNSNLTDNYTGEPMLHGHNSGTNLERTVQLNCQNPAQFGMPVNARLQYNGQPSGDLYCKGMDRDICNVNDTPPHERLWDRRMLWLDRTEYIFGPQVRQRLPSNVFPMLNDEVFFYMFYQHCRDISQMESAERLYLKGWRFHLGMKLWMKKVQPTAPNCGFFVNSSSVACYVNSNLYDVFLPITWGISRHQLDIDERCWEDRPKVPHREQQ